MAQGFDATNAPFDRLSASEVETVRAALDIGYFRPGETILRLGAAADCLFIVMKGHVEERDGADVVASRGPGDCFDSRALVQGESAAAFVAAEETLCYLLPREPTMRLINQNPRFAAFFYLDVSRRLDAAANEADDTRFGATMHARVRELHLHPALFVEASDSIETAARAMSEGRANAVFVRDGARIGIVTATNLANAAILQRRPLDGAVAEAAQYEICACEADDFVSTALMKMTKRNKRRIAVRENGVYVGVLEDIDLLAFVAGGSQLVAARIDRAANEGELARAAADIARQTRLLRRQGVRIEIVAEIVSDLNRRLMARLFRLVAPGAVAQKGCLIVMGSEGRGEQTVRTDQDNALILAEPVPEADLAAFRRAFSGALARFGFPPCPGAVMVENPFWSKTAAEYGADFRGWLAAPDEQAVMNMAIVYDAEAVAGDPDLLRDVKSLFVGAMRGEPLHLARFARAVDAFPTPIGLFNAILTARADAGGLDLKKGGIFPIVHGVRALAIERGLTETNTAARIARLAEQGVLAPDFARDLTQALRYLMTLRLDAELSDSTSDRVRPGALSGMERELLRDALKIVKQFREIVRRRFNLGMF